MFYHLSDFIGNYFLMRIDTIIIIIFCLLTAIGVAAWVASMINRYGIDLIDCFIVPSLCLFIGTLIISMCMSFVARSTHTSTNTNSGTVKSIRQVQNTNDQNSIQLTIQSKKGLVTIDEPITEDDSVSHNVKNLEINQNISFKLEGFRLNGNVKDIRIKSLITEQGTHYKKNQQKINVQDLF